MAYKYKIKEADQVVGDIKISNGVKTQVTGIDSNTGAISWSVEYIPNFEQMYELSTDLVDISKSVYTKTKDDKVLRDIYEEARKLRNRIRTHIRSEYPDQYKTFGPGSMKEAAQDIKVELPNVTKTKANNQITTVSGFADFLLDAWDEIAEKEQDGIQKNAFIKQARAFLQKAKGEDKKLPQAAVDEDVDEASMSGAAGAYNTPYAFVRKPLKPKGSKKKKKSKYKMSKPSGLVNYMDYAVSEGGDPGASLGPGPKASEDGVNDNAYVKQFKYKLVKKNKDGTYVQPPSTLPVRKLWGE
tara:strand:+ start:789 stop:1685 length:897 start_codon:yes stop_codon:yes gene_type:complete